MNENGCFQATMMELPPYLELFIATETKLRQIAMNMVQNMFISNWLSSCEVYIKQSTIYIIIKTIINRVTVTIGSVLTSELLVDMF